MQRVRNQQEDEGQMIISKEDLESIIDILESNARGFREDISDLLHHLEIVENQISRLKKLNHDIQSKKKESLSEDS